MEASISSVDSTCSNHASRGPGGTKWRGGGSIFTKEYIEKVLIDEQMTILDIEWQCSTCDTYEIIQSQKRLNIRTSEHFEYRMYFTYPLSRYSNILLQKADFIVHFAAQVSTCSLCASCFVIVWTLLYTCTVICWGQR